MLSANREFHVVAGVIIFPTHPGSRINLLRAGKTLRAKAAVREKKCVLLPARFFSNLVPVPDSRESELGLVRYGPASRVHRGVFGPFEGSFPIGIPASPDKFLAIREFHVVHGMCPSFQCARARRSTCCESGRLCAQAWQRRWENSGTFSKTLFCRPVFTRVVDVAPDVGFRRSWYRRKACVTYFLTVQALHRGEFGFARYDPANGGRRNVPYAKGGGQFDSSFWSGQWIRSNLGQTWSNLGQTWSSNLVKPREMCPGPSYWEYLMWRSVVRSCWFGSGCPVLRTDTEKNPGGTLIDDQSSPTRPIGPVLFRLGTRVSPAMQKNFNLSWKFFQMVGENWGLKLVKPQLDNQTWFGNSSEQSGKNWDLTLSRIAIVWSDPVWKFIQTIGENWDLRLVKSQLDNQTWFGNSSKRSGTNWDLTLSRIAIGLPGFSDPWIVLLCPLQMSDRGSGSGGHRRSDRLAKGKSVAYAPESSPDTDDEYDTMEDVRTRLDASLARNLQAELDAEAAGLAPSAARAPPRPGVVIGRSAGPSETTRPSPQPGVTTGPSDAPSAAPRRACHNPIFTPGIFSGVGTQNEAARTKSACSDEGSSPRILPKRRSETHFPRASIPYFTGRKRVEKRESCGQNCEKTVRHLAKFWLSVVDKTAYLGGNVCAKILSDPLQLGPRAKTLRQEVHFSYHTQLSDRQELLRSSRNLSQKLTPWHKEHSDGLRSQDHISRTQTRLCARPVPLKSRVFLTRNKLICEPGHIGKRTHPCTTWNSRIAKNLSGSAGIPDRKTALKRTKNTPRKLSDGTKNVKIRHRELGQICARTGTRFEKKRAGSKTHFFSRTAAFARRVFPARNKLIREPGCVGKIMTPATSWNSRFADSIPRLTGIRIGRVHKNSSDTPTSGSHNSLVRTPIRANFISLERGRRELSDDMPHDPF
uniref:Uncharacterized protein n=1 Tax=Fagus sylvatica TaxID=28930 RepID=A0A2N9H3T6_FAGSY